MKNFAKVLGALLVAGALTVSVAQADTLFYYGHGGLNEGHTQFAALLAANDCGGTFVVDNGAALPSLAGYNLVLISTPGWQDPGAFFSAAEKSALDAFLVDGNHRLVLIGEWDGFYGDGQAVLIDLMNYLGVGGMAFIPGVFDSGCFAYDCGGNLGTDPLVAGLTHVCKAATAIWNPGAGAAVAYPFENTADPWVISNGTNVPCLVGIGDSNTLSDSCGHLADSDTATFALRLCTINCAGDPVPTQTTTWGGVKALYR
jgi:hypothetical protein